MENDKRLNLEELSKLSSPQELTKYIHEHFPWDKITQQGVKNLRTFAFYEAFLKGACAVYEEFGNGKEFDISALEYLKELDNLEGIY